MVDKIAVTRWDWKEQVDVDELNILLKRAGFKGSINAVTTQNDQNCIVVSSEVIDDDKAQEVFDADWDGDDDIPSADETPDCFGTFIRACSHGCNHRSACATKMEESWK